MAWPATSAAAIKDQVGGEDVEEGLVVHSGEEKVSGKKRCQEPFPGDTWGESFQNGEERECGDVAAVGLPRSELAASLVGVFETEEKVSGTFSAIA